MNAYDPAALCMCGHNQSSHDAQGCIICAAQNQRCDQFWTQAEYDDAVQRAQLTILQVEREQKEQRGRA